MFDLEQFKIDFKAINQDVTHFDFKLNNEYFTAVEAKNIQNGSLTIALNIYKMADSFKLTFNIHGSVVVTCDLCLDEMDQEINTSESLIVRLGEEYSDEDDLIIVPQNKSVLDVSWFIYEFIELNIPFKHVHAPGKCNPAMMKMLQEHSANRSSNKDKGTSVDPHWAGLEKLKTIIKD